MAGIFHYINNEEHESKTDVACKWKEASKRGRMKYKGGLFIVVIDNLFMTSKNETTNSTIHQFTNLKCCKMSFKAFKMKKQGLRCLLK